MLLELALSEILESNEYETISKVSTRVHAHELADRLLRKKKNLSNCSLQHQTHENLRVPSRGYLFS